MWIQILYGVRVGAGMFERRGGLRYLKYRQARKRMYARGQISSWRIFGKVFLIQSCRGPMSRIL